MKIFDWVHRRFNPAILRDELGGKSEGGCMALGPQEGVDLSHVLDGWKDFGILTIGTFGYDPLEHLEQDPLAKEDMEVEQGFPAEAEAEADELLEEGEGELEEAADAELDPLIPAKVARELQEFGDSAALTWDQTGTSSEMELTSVVELKKRVTLADLFSVDSDAEDGEQVPGDSSSKGSSKCGEKQAFKKDANGRSLAKKILNGIRKEDLRPMRKINRLMKKMMGRKVHPEVPGAGKANEEENQQLMGKINPGAAKAQGSSAHEVGESRPLLQSHR